MPYDLATRRLILSRMTQLWRAKIEIRGMFIVRCGRMKTVCPTFYEAVTQAVRMAQVVELREDRGITYPTGF